MAIVKTISTVPVKSDLQIEFEKRDAIRDIKMWKKYLEKAKQKAKMKTA